MRELEEFAHRQHQVTVPLPSPRLQQRREGWGGAELRASQAREGGCGVVVTLGKNGQCRADMGQKVRGGKTETQ